MGLTACEILRPRNAVPCFSDLSRISRFSAKIQLITRHFSFNLVLLYINLHLFDTIRAEISEIFGF